MEPYKEVFRSNTIVILVPGIFLGAALILRNTYISALPWVLLALGVITTIAVFRSFTTILIGDSKINIKNLRKAQEIKKEDIVRQSRSVSNAKGIETVTWKLHLKEGNRVIISSDLIKDQEGLKRSLDQFLKGVPKNN